MADQTNPPPDLATFARLITEASAAVGAEITRRAEEVRPAIEALTRQLALDGEAMATAFGAGMAQIASSVQPSARPAVTVEQLLELARPDVDRPQLGRVEVGALVHPLLKSAFPLGERLSPAPVSALYGVPVVTPDGMDPRAWRLLDTDGHVIKEGTL